MQKFSFILITSLSIAIVLTLGLELLSLAGCDWQLALFDMSIDWVGHLMLRDAVMIAVFLILNTFCVSWAILRHGARRSDWVIFVLLLLMAMKVADLLNHFSFTPKACIPYGA